MRSVIMTWYWNVKHVVCNHDLEWNVKHVVCNHDLELECSIGMYSLNYVFLVLDSLSSQLGSVE